MKYPQAGVNLGEKQVGFSCGDVYWQTKKNKSKFIFEYESDGSLMAWMPEESIPIILLLKIN